MAEERTKEGAFGEEMARQDGEEVVMKTENFVTLVGDRGEQEADVRILLAKGHVGFPRIGPAVNFSDLGPL